MEAIFKLRKQARYIVDHLAAQAQAKGEIVIEEIHSVE